MLAFLHFSARVSMCGAMAAFVFAILHVGDREWLQALFQLTCGAIDLYWYRRFVRAYRAEAA